MAVFIRALALVALAAGFAWPSGDPANAQGYPNRPIRVVVPFPAGGPTDTMARIVSDRLGQVLGQSIVIENRGGGAGGSIGAKFVASSDPDGYTVLITPGGSLTTGPAVHANIGYDPAKAFVPVALLMTSPQIVAVHPDVPVKTLRRARGLRQGQSGQDHLGLAGLRHRAASARRIVQAGKQASTSCTCPIAGPRRCWPPSSPARCRWLPIRRPPRCRTSNPAGCGRWP